ncbi:uncharacterized protein EI97DRAFT_377416 [Westerdykella ornata]|uniref:LDB19 N-terminal domain-containing protein n=1 Tax=Westerdykella ornata TaxID=318751 RepID=A0A6A6JIX7_WESOR|nr:uncharacterized protein EI97DRAFT_377416 [Westerdykella ornata]KAF2276407.1 hypothetical protein EI97DRAFT_377416 [Westerdykella ornata]
MPGRLLSFVKATPSSSHKASQKTQKSPSAPTSLLPPYSLDPPPSATPPNPRTRSEESLVMDVFKRHSLGSRHDRKSPKIEPQQPATIDMEFESPPVVFYNSPATSTGALLSGQLKLHVAEPHLTLKSFDMRLLAVVATKRPVAPHCPDCLTQTTELHKWEFLAAPVTRKYNHGVHYFPFSHLLPGHLPATTQGSLATLNYYLTVTATTSSGERIAFKRELDIKRAIYPGNEKHSIRIFPPTNLTASVTLPPVIHPIGDFPIEMRLSGIVQNLPDSQTRWRLRKLNWRIEETQKFIAPACSKHASKVGGEGKGVLHEDIHVVATDEVKHGWKTDFEQGNIDVEFRAAVNPALKAVCDMESPNGMQVKHNLIIEMVVAEEWAPLKKLSQATPTGAARVLRTQFHLVLTERCGMGISWDEEQPPLYEDVPCSPPTYVEDCQFDDHDDSLRL